MRARVVLFVTAGVVGLLAGVLLPTAWLIAFCVVVLLAWLTALAVIR